MLAAYSQRFNHYDHDGGILGSTSTGVVTDDTWKCIPYLGQFENGWNWQLDFDDSAWPQASVVGTNDNGTYFAIYDEISPQAKWIWTELRYNNICCRKTLC